LISSDSSRTVRPAIASIISALDRAICITPDKN
jgi:hypothetical protein